MLNTDSFFFALIAAHLVFADSLFRAMLDTDFADNYITAALNADSVVNNVTAASLLAAELHLRTILNADSVFLDLIVASLVAAEFHHLLHALQEFIHIITHRYTMHHHNAFITLFFLIPLRTCKVSWSRFSDMHL